jgi:hypothetical protein
MSSISAPPRSNIILYQTEDEQSWQEFYNQAMTYLFVYFVVPRRLTC